MRKLLVALLWCALVATAAAQQPTDESIDRLFTVLNTEGMMNNMMSSMDRISQTMMQQSGRQPTPADEALRERMKALTLEEMSWANMKPKLAQVYRESFTQEEIDGLIAFYESPVGRSYVAKMPLVMAKTMQVSQQQMQSLMPKLKAIADEARREAGKQ